MSRISSLPSDDPLHVLYPSLRPWVDWQWCSAASSSGTHRRPDNTDESWEGKFPSSVPRDQQAEERKNKRSHTAGAGLTSLKHAEMLPQVRANITEAQEKLLYTQQSQPLPIGSCQHPAAQPPAVQHLHSRKRAQLIMTKTGDKSSTSRSSPPPWRPHQEHASLPDPRAQNARSSAPPQVATNVALALTLARSRIWWETTHPTSPQPPRKTPIWFRDRGTLIRGVAAATKTPTLDTLPHNPRAQFRGSPYLPPPQQPPEMGGDHGLAGGRPRYLLRLPFAEGKGGETNPLPTDNTTHTT